MLELKAKVTLRVTLGHPWPLSEPALPCSSFHWCSQGHCRAEVKTRCNFLSKSQGKPLIAHDNVPHREQDRRGQIQGTSSPMAQLLCLEQHPAAKGQLSMEEQEWLGSGPALPGLALAVPSSDFQGLQDHPGEVASPDTSFSAHKDPLHSAQSGAQPVPPPQYLRHPQSCHLQVPQEAAFQ